MVTSTLVLFNLDVYVLLDLSDTLSFVTPYIEVSITVSRKTFSKPLLVSTQVDDLVIGNVYTYIFMSHLLEVTSTDLLMLEIVDSHTTILAMDWLHFYYA